MSNALIRKSLEQSLATWASAQSPPVPIAFENVSFKKPATNMLWAEAFLIPNDAMLRELSATRKRELGIFQVNCWGAQGAGMGALSAFADAVAALYPVVPKSGSLSIEKPPKVGAAFDGGDGWEVVPVTIKYRYET